MKIAPHSRFFDMTTEGEKGLHRGLTMIAIGGQLVLAFPRLRLRVWIRRARHLLYRRRHRSFC
jgi:hypothetical protein